MGKIHGRQGVPPHVMTIAHEAGVPVHIDPHNPRHWHIDVDFDSPAAQRLAASISRWRRGRGHEISTTPA